jgi:hypothetical protein
MLVAQAVTDQEGSRPPQTKKARPYQKYPAEKRAGSVVQVMIELLPSKHEALGST